MSSVTECKPDLIKLVLLIQHVPCAALNRDGWMEPNHPSLTSNDVLEPVHGTGNQGRLTDT